jgi:hypothetical protein
MKIIYRLLIATLALLILSQFAYANEECANEDTKQILEVFVHAIKLNESFKSALINKNENEYRPLRVQVESYSEEKLFPCVKHATAILSKQGNKEVLQKLMQVVVSFNNSADETLSTSLGSIFARNPNEIELSIKWFPKPERDIITKSVRTGWLNVKKDFDTNLVLERDARIQRLDF